MEWFKGGVPNAIATCRQQRALFIVYIHDDSAGSTNMEGVWSSREIKSVLTTNKFVALKIAKDSVEYLQFSQLYPVFMFPTVFCIGMTGQALVVMNGAQNVEQTKKKLTEAFQKLQGELSPPPTASTTTQENGPITQPQEPPSIAQTPSPPSTVTTTGSLSGDVGAVGEGLPTEGEGLPTEGEGLPTEGEGLPTEGEGLPTEGDVTASDSTEEQVERYQEKMRERRKEKAEEQIQKEKRQELDRRQQSKNLGQFRQMQEDRRNQSWIEERRKEQLEAKRAREEVKAKLEQDRLERLAQKQQRATETAELRQRSSAASAIPVTSSVFSSVSTTGKCRVQLKLPGGRAAVVEMNRNDTLSLLRDRAAQELGQSPTSLTLSSVYPRRELGPDIDSQTLVQLQLVPTGVVIVRVNQGVRMMSLQSSHGDGGILSSLWGALVGLLQLIVGFLTFVKNAITGLFSSGPPQRPSEGYQGNDTQAQTKSPPSSYGGRERVKKFRQEDFQDDQDDENKSTYNGNSTQQQ